MFGILNKSSDWEQNTINLLLSEARKSEKAEVQISKERKKSE